MSLRNRPALYVAALACVLAACPAKNEPPSPRGPVQPRTGTITLTIIGTNDLHGAVDRLPILAGYVANVRARRAADGGELLLIDAGDMFQGTLASNLTEGAAVVAAYNHIGYDAAAIGNHEFDFGPEGPASTAISPTDDPRGALRARAKEATFPFLMANVLDRDTGKRPMWDNVTGSLMIEKGPVIVGLIGVTTEATPFATMPANFLGLEMSKPAMAIAAEAADLRERGAQVVVVAAHVGSKCKELTDPNDLSSCDREEELFEMVEALPAGAVDVIVAGHTHAAMAHRVNDIAVIESYANGRAFGRVDLRINPSGVVTGVTIAQPRDLCPLGDGGEPVPAETCAPGEYEGAPVRVSAEVTSLIAPAGVKARDLEQKPLGIELAAEVKASYGEESALGNLFTDLMLASVNGADVALTNGGGLRADLPPGPLTYGSLYRAMPFDNLFAVVTLNGKHLRKMVSNNLYGGGAFLSWGGMTVKATCKGGQLEVVMKDRAGKVIEDEQTLTLLTSDFLATAGAIGRLKLPDGSIEITDVIIRDAMADALTRMGGKSGGKPGEKPGGKLVPSKFHDPAKPRVDFPKPRPVKCGP
ncbi:MAG: bifunctional metallophosphatase/5'-nucleotidase [Deltaproteobacteria bacterium]|nr:bifunctional metallophosphatase/5'-nucleotidase [Kofleriaceae bacterium]